MSLLRGRTEYGDSVEDEWVIVWLLRELTKKFADLWIKVTDSDGEFLLIEASGTLPAWLEPEVAENRVWLNHGQLKILKPGNAARSSKRTSEKLALAEAHQIILKDAKRIMHSTSIEEEAFYRLRNYPGQIKDNMHHSVVVLPRKVAFLLKQKPAYVAPAVEAFYLRDPIALKPLQSKENVDKMVFSPKDQVTVSVKFPRVAYAQLKSQNFPPPAVFNDNLPSEADSKSFARAETGMKLTCGFEMLVTDSQYQDKPVVREMKMLLEDLETGDEVLPSDEEVSKWEQREDDEKWLDISFDDLEKELGGKKAQENGGKRNDFGDKAAQENLQRIVKQFEEFLNDDKAGAEGAGMFDEDSDDELNDDDDLDDEDEDEDEDDNDIGEDKEGSFDEDEFSKMMQEMMGMPPEVMKEIMSGKLGDGATSGKGEQSNAVTPSTNSKDRVEELDDSDSEPDEEDMEKIMKQMGAELRGYGALNLGHKMGKIGAAGRAVTADEADDSDLSDDDDDDDEGENDVDINLARNLLESFKSQAGMAGPGGNLMGMMGLGLPRDETDVGEGSSSRGKSKQK